MKTETTVNPAHDGELLRKYRTSGDQEAFAQVLRRHGPMVLRAARSAVADAAAAEDVAQAAFLALARKAAALEAAASVAGWLCHVTLCLARDERRKAVRRQAREQEAVMLAGERNDSPAFPEGALAALYDELGKLPEKYRQPVVLHHLEGLSYEAAAALCGCTDKAFSVRLTRAREQLRQRLAGRGVALGADGVTGVLEAGATTAVLPAALVAATCQAASLIAAGKTLTGSGLVSAKVAYLTKSALKTLFWAKVKFAAAATVLTAGVAVGGGVVARQAFAHRTAAPVPALVAPAPATSGQVWAWGDNPFGQLGDGTTVNRPTPVQVSGLVDATTVAAGTAYSVALRSDRTVWAWGQNDKGQLGDGTTTDRVAPVPVRLPNGTLLANVAAVAAGGAHTVALTTDGRVWVWGDNEFGQLGDGTTLRRLTPVPVPGLAGVTAIAAGGSHTAILKDDRTVWTWGRNEAGQLGDGTTTDRHTPGPVKQADGSPFAAAAIAAGRSHTAALRAGRIWGWGSNRNGQLGDDLAPRLTPGPVVLAPGGAPAGVVAIAAAGNRTAALMADRTVWIRGVRDELGGVFDGLISPMRNAGKGVMFQPVQIKLADGRALSGVTALGVGDYCAVARTEDGGVWTWGGVFDRFTGPPTASAAPRDPPPRNDEVFTPQPRQPRLADGTALAGVTAVAAGGGHTVVVVAERPVRGTAILNKTTGDAQ